MAPYASILDRFDEIARSHGEVRAIECDGVGLSYSELDRAARILAMDLSQAGVRPGDFVPLLMKRSVEYIVGVLAILRCGAAYAPIDPESPPSRREAMLRPLQNTCVLIEDDLVLPAGCRPVRVSAAMKSWREGAAVPENLAGPCTDGESPAYVMYTSGSTGEPKGVVIPHRGIVRLTVHADFAEMKAGQRWAVMSAVAFDASTLEVWGALLNGGTCVVQSTPYPSLDELVNFFVDQRIDCAWLTAALFNAIVDWDCASLGGLSQLLTGGERESVRHIRDFVRQCPSVRLIHGYGPTENTTFSLCHTVTEQSLASERVAIGRSIRGSIHRIVQIAGIEREHEAQEGELLVGGDGLALGYLGRDDLTQDRFVTDREGLRWYRTGDLVRERPCGDVEYLGRIDRQVKIRGHRVELEEVESAIALCPSVKQSAVFVQGESSTDRHLIGVYAPAEEGSEEEVRLHLMQRLPRTMIPEVLIGISELPMNSNGKLDRAALHQLIVSPAHKPVITSESRTATEQALVEIVRSRVPGASQAIEVSHSFCQIGGHSLAAMRVSADVYERFGARLRPVEVLTLPSLRTIAEKIDRLLEDEVEAGSTKGWNASGQPARDEVGDIRRRTLVESERDPTGEAMLVHQAWFLNSTVDTAQLKEIWAELIARHSALSTGFRIHTEGLVPYRINPDDADWYIEEGGLKQSSQELAVALDDAVLARIRQRISADGPPIRVQRWTTNDGITLLMVSYHHAAVDEWSLEILQSEFATRLAGGSLGPAQPYETYLALEEQWIDYSEAKRIADGLLDTGPATKPLPRGGPQDGHVFVFPPELANEIGQRLDWLSSRTQASPSCIALHAFGKVLCDRYGNPGRWVMTPVSKRIAPELQSVVGCCLDMRVIDCTTPLGSDSIGCVQEQIRCAQSESVLPIEDVVRHARAQRPETADHVTRFGYTYRRIEDAPVKIGQHTLVPIEVPQFAARFGIALHVERRSLGTRIWLEASRSTVSDADLQYIADQLTIHLLDRDSSINVTRDPAASLQSTIQIRETGAQSSLHPPRTVEVLQSLWAEAVGSLPSRETDFIACGGSSLRAMQLGASIHDRTGLKLHVGEFLMDPTFDGLLRWVRDDPQRPYSDFKRKGDSLSVSDRVSLGFPGSYGRAIDLHGFWAAYSDRVPCLSRMIGFDLVAISQGISADAEPEAVVDAFIERAADIARSNAGDAPLEIVGYSLGGLIGIGVADLLIKSGLSVERMVLLDTYAPVFLVRSKHAIAAKLHARIRSGALWTRSHNSIGRDSTLQSTKVQGSSHSLLHNRAFWQRVHHCFSRWHVPRVDVPTVLVRSTSSARLVRPLWKASTNGLGSSLRGPVRVVSVDVSHLEMLTVGSVQTAVAAASGVHAAGQIG